MNFLLFKIVYGVITDTQTIHKVKYTHTECVWQIEGKKDKESIHSFLCLNKCHCALKISRAEWVTVNLRSLRLNTRTPPAGGERVWWHSLQSRWGWLLCHANKSQRIWKAKKKWISRDFTRCGTEEQFYNSNNWKSTCGVAAAQIWWCMMRLLIGPTREIADVNWKRIWRTLELRCKIFNSNTSIHTS